MIEEAMPDVPFQLGEQTESAWIDLSRHIEWSKGFWVAFLFSPSELAADTLRSKTESSLKKKQCGMSVHKPETPEALHNLLAQLFVESDNGSRPLTWIQAVKRDTPFGQTDERPWAKAWESFLLRANERREQFRARFSNGLVIAAPDELKSLFREAAPDLWSVRALALDLDNPVFPQSSIEQRFIDIEIPEEKSAPDPELALQEARRLEEQSPDAHLAIGQAYLHVAEGACDEGNHRQALDAAEKAIKALRRPAADHSDISLSHLAIALNNLGIVLNALGEGEAAIDVTREAVDINRKLSESRPDTFLPELTKSLHNLGIRLSNLGQREESLNAIQEAVDIRRRLSTVHPDTFLPDLAMSLLNLSMRLKELGQQNEALNMTREAVDIFRRLSAAHPELFLPDLALSLNNLGVRLGDLGRAEEAFAAEEEAVRILAKAFERKPKSFSQWMSVVVFNYMHIAAAAGREVDMNLLSPIQEKLSDLLSQAR